MSKVATYIEFSVHPEKTVNHSSNYKEHKSNGVKKN